MQSHDDIFEAQGVEIGAEEKVTQLVVLKLTTDRCKELSIRRMDRQRFAARNGQECGKVIAGVGSLDNVLAHCGVDLVQAGEFRGEEIGDEGIAAETPLADDELESVTELGLGDV
jgi:hypothetical protein